MRWMALTWSLLLATPVYAEADLRLILDRQPDGLVTFMALPVADVETVLGGRVIGLADADGTIPFERIQKSGTAEDGDAVIERLELLAGGKPALVETMSVMAHPKDLEVPFNDPYDGYFAMSVCTAADPGKPLYLAELDLYHGAYSHAIDGFSDLSLRLGNVEPITVSLVQFAEGRKIDAREVTLSPGQALQLEPVKSVFRWVWWGALALGLAVLAGVASIWAARRRRAPQPKVV